MVKYTHHFLPLDPAPAEEAECATLSVSGTINYSTKEGHDVVVRLLADQAGVRVIAVTVPEAAQSSATFDDWMQKINETVLAAIRLSYDPAAIPVFSDKGFFTVCYESEKDTPEYKIVFQKNLNPDYHVDVPAILGVFQVIHKQDVAPIAQLVADAQVPSLPPQYRVLSLVRALELLYPTSTQFNTALDTHDQEFASLGLHPRSLRNALPEIRNWCAHGSSRGKYKPMVGIGYNNQLLRPLAELLGKIVAVGLKSKHGLKTNVSEGHFIS